MTEPLSSGWFARRSAFLQAPRTARLAVWLVPLAFGLLSLLLGQDDNWDLKNYHWYNPWALLHGRLGLDLAPGVWQSYFNPGLDLLYYCLNTALPAPLAGFVMGCLHGLNFVLVFQLARCLLPADAQNQRRALLLAGAGVLGAGFLSELGNSMGDNMVALPVLLALLLVLRQWQRLQQASFSTALRLLPAGLLIGAAAGLKLTNAMYALALCLALLLAAGTLLQRLRLAFVFGCGVLAGLALSCGWWFFKMWQQFGNPLFPQMNHVFHSPLAQQAANVDTNYLPKSALEALLWPFLFTLDSRRVSELALHQLVWPLLYVAFIALALAWLWRRFVSSAASAPAMPPKTRFVLVFFALAYLLWLKMFGIYRYLVPLELLAPLVLWQLAHALLPAVRAARTAGVLLVLATLAVLPFSTWGHAPWAAQNFTVSVPPFESPATTTIYFAHGDPPMGWLVPQLPASLVFLSIGAGFPDSVAYRTLAEGIAQQRGGPRYVMLTAAANHEEFNLLRKNAAVEWSGLNHSDAGCAKLTWLMQKVRFHVDVQALPANAAPARCTLVLQPKYQLDLAEKNRQVVAAAAGTLAGYGLRLLADSCVVYAAQAGRQPNPYQMCRVTPAATLAAPP